MAKSLKDALVGAGVVRPEDTPEARQESAWRQRQAKEAAETAERMAAAPPKTPFEAPARGVIVDRAYTKSLPEESLCTDCGEPFEPDAPEHKPFGRADQCGPCAQDEEPGPKRRRGQMVWTHKTAPVLEIEGGRKLSPEEIAAMRRR